MRSSSSTTNEVSDLRRELRQLKLLVASLVARVEFLESIQREGSEFEVVVGPTAPEPSSASACAAQSPQPSATVGPAGEADVLRREVAEEIGRFLRRCLDGQARGSSGRHRVRLANRYYIVCRDHTLKVYNPPLILSAFREVKSCASSTGSLVTRSSWGSPACGKLVLPSRRQDCLGSHLRQRDG